VIRDKSVLAVIPARGGSKGLPNKNILDFAGKPLIAWSIEAASGSKYIDRFILSTDSQEIANVAKQYNCEVPFIRPRKLATDDANGNDVMLHVIELIDGNYDILLFLQPTSPLRITDDIDHALEVMVHEKASALVSVCKSSKPLHWHHTIENDGTLKPVYPHNVIATNRQDQAPTYIPNGALYIASTNDFKDAKTFYTDSTLAYIMPPERSVDIDSLIDFYTAEALIG
jgi:CMP-N,N'-diacetyllegionaminic acid synthase